MTRFRTVRAYGLSAFDQAISGATNLIMVAVVAQKLDSDAFGAFAVAYSGFVMAVAVSRTYLGIPIALSVGIPQDSRRRLSGGALLVTVAAAPLALLLIGGLIPLILLWTTGQGNFVICGIIAAAAIFAVLQDLLRYHAIASSRPIIAIVSDLVWLSGVLALALPAAAGLSLTVFLSLWCLAIASSGAVGMVLSRPRFSLTEAKRLALPGSGAREGATLVVLVNTGMSASLGIVVAGLFSPANAGSLRGAGTLLGPTNLLLATLDLFLLGRLRVQGPVKRRRLQGVAAAGLILILLVWAVVLFSVPDRIGTLLLGETWSGARRILPWTTLEYGFSIMAGIAALELKLRDSGRAMIVANVASGAVILSLSVALGLAGAEFIFVPVALVVGSAIACAVMLWGAYGDVSSGR